MPSLPVLGEAAGNDLVQWDLDMHKQGLLVGQYMIIQKAYEIHRYMFGSMHSVGLVGRGCCDRFMSQNGEFSLRTTQVIKRVRKEAILEGLQSFFCEDVSAHNQADNKKEKLWNMNDNGLINKQNLRKVVASKGSRNMWSKCADANFHMTFVVCVSAA